ncbi:uncharacterized protein LAESUDRAFT_725836 [Laetiporus sulphureus 93-53]|uniref:INO80 complex subunit F domain-containing protein n=1 Tax=Laetiporus sulphureus 93-53 TaxID=1314785 RepID=A0A165E7P3_9APHY|nr:uncharacterized protein LAESUDRAFT_725836 [Laetiporus sulphureus 93-53]KZT06399.1 hypothetical protein LAESUDRAFT_725836 [Laetiporus sulphureus 93-53]
MSRQPSPGPSHHLAPMQPMYHPPGVAMNTQFIAKQRNKAIVSGITAGVEDTKYQNKYRELKKKVKEIEADNDRLYFKLLLAKKNIRRMNLERAILYERLAAVPPTPGRHVQELPPEQDPIFHQHPPAPPEHARVIDVSDPALVEYMRTRPDARLVLGPDGRVVAVEDVPPAAVPNGTPAVPSQPPPHGLPLVYGFRHDSGPGYDPNHQLPPLPPMIPLIHPTAEAPPDLPSLNEHHGAPYQPAYAHPHPHPDSSHHPRSSSARPDLDPMSGRDARMDTLPPAAHGHSHSGSPSAPPESQGDRGRRHDVQELAHPRPHSHTHAPQPTPAQTSAQSLPTSEPSHSPASTRGSDRSAGRIHNHQRVGPGANINREMTERDWELRRELEYQRELERERERERERELEYRLRLEREEQEALTAEWMRQQHAQTAATNANSSQNPSRSVSPSGSPIQNHGSQGSRAPSRPTSGEATAYRDDGERGRSKAPRVSNLIGVDRELGYEEHNGAARGSAAEIPAATVDARKRLRGDVEMGDECAGEGRSPAEGSRASSRQGNRAPEGRAVKRRHMDDGGGELGAGEQRDEPMDQD